MPNLTLPEGALDPRHRRRMNLLGHIERQRRHLEATAAVAQYDRTRQSAVALLTSPQVRHAFDVRRAEPRILDCYGDNSFGWSLLMARRLVEAGVNMVQVNMGNFGSWDLHGNNFPCLKNYLFPPTDRAVSALLDDLHERGLLASTLVVAVGEMGLMPRINHWGGRDHWAYGCARRGKVHARGRARENRAAARAAHRGPRRGPDVAVYRWGDPR